MMGEEVFTGYIYLITNKLNGKKYVGCTKHSVEHRWKQHCYVAMKGKKMSYIAKAIRKYGVDNFSVEQLAETNSYADMLELEIKCISEHNSKKPNGYNLTDGGDGFNGWKPTFAHLKAMSDRLMGHETSEETRRKIAEAHIGMSHSDETCAKISSIMSQKWLDDSYRETQTTKVIEGYVKNRDKHISRVAISVEIDGVLYESQSAAARAIGVNAETVRYRINNNFPGYISHGNSNRVAQRLTTRSVVVLNIEYESIRLAADATGVSESAIKNRIKQGWPGYFYTDEGQRPTVHSFRMRPVIYQEKIFSGIVPCARHLGLDGDKVSKSVKNGTDGFSYLDVTRDEAAEIRQMVLSDPRGYITLSDISKEAA